MGKSDLEMVRGKDRKHLQKTYPLAKYDVPKIIEKMRELTEKKWRPHHFALKEIYKGTTSGELCLGKGQFRRALRGSMEGRHVINFTSLKKQGNEHCQGIISWWN